VKALLAAGAGVNMKNNKGVTALILASGYGHIEIVKALIAEGADLNTKDSRGKTALMIASENRHYGIVKALVAEGADVKMKSSVGQTDLVLASEIDTRPKWRGIVVHVKASSEQDLDVPASDRAVKIKVLPFKDSRAEKRRIGERTAAFNVSMGYVYFFRNVSDFMTDAVSDGLRAAGHAIVETGDEVSVAGEILTFWIETETTVFYWDVVGSIEVNIRAQSSKDSDTVREMRYVTKQVKRTYWWPTKTLLGEVLTMCVEDLLRQIRFDSTWLTFFEPALAVRE
jgi:hypothetical protein